MNYDIPIVIVAYNRPNSLKRVLNSINNAIFENSVKLYISIDGGGDNQSQDIAGNFDWSNGEKEIIIHKENIGLRNHILSAGDLTEKHDGIIILEDDLYVSPVFYYYVQQSFSYYLKDQEIGGFSLYAHQYNETAQFPFYPLSDDSDIFFLQYASSWGQFWSKDQWSDFKKWYNKNECLNFDNDKQLPPNIIAWPDSSWKKYFVKFLIQEDSYFVYPRVSLTSNFGDAGKHMIFKEKFLQVPLQYQKQQFKFKKIEESYSVYDVYCEILPDRLNKLVPELRRYDYEVDLYGIKTTKNIDCPYILTYQDCSSSLLSYGREMKPLESNIIENVPGGEINLTPIKNFSDTNYWTKLRRCVEKNELCYFYSLRKWHFKE